MTHTTLSTYSETPVYRKASGGFSTLSGGLSSVFLTGFTTFSKLSASYMSLYISLAGAALMLLSNLLK